MKSGISDWGLAIGGKKLPTALVANHPSVSRLSSARYGLTGIKHDSHNQRMFKRTINSAIARVCMAMVLFAQLAIAAYACEPSKHQSAVAVEQAAMQDCEERDSNTTNLCREHCKAGNQAAEMPSFAVPPPGVRFGVIPDLDRVSPAAVLNVLKSLIQSAAQPPPQILFQVFRI